ncbi:MAG: hypothetical protein VX265_12355 [Myxococcota bacterium]|nr:hypothetical protein [Myxococcota bacterium]MEC8422567.1 hypothetical protein [Myxococcota bacterium]
MDEHVEGTIHLRGEPDSLVVEIDAGGTSLRLPVEALAPAFAHPVAFTHVVEALLVELEENQGTLPPGVLEAVAGILDASAARARALLGARSS